MEKYIDLKEVLLVFLKVYFDRCVNDDEDEELVINDFVANNRLALGKPEPLAKNKQTKQFCTFYNSECIKEFCSVTPYWHKCKHLIAK